MESTVLNFRISLSSHEFCILVLRQCHFETGYFVSPILNDLPTVQKMARRLPIAILFPNFHTPQDILEGTILH